MIDLQAHRGLRRRLIQASWLAIGFPVAVLAIGQRFLDLFAAGRPVRRILVIRLDLLGDVVLSLPAVRSLRAGYPDAEIDLLVRPSAAAIARSSPDVDQVLTFDPDKIRPSGSPLKPSSWQDLRLALQDVRSARYDIAVGLFGIWASVFALASGAPRRVGYRKEGFPFVYNTPVSGRRYQPVRHERSFCLRLARRAGGGPTVPGNLLSVPDAALQMGESLLSSNGISSGPIVLIHAGSAAGTAKRWTAAGWAGLVDSLEAAGIRSAFIGSKDEQFLTDEVIRQCVSRPIVLTGKTSLDELLAVLSIATLVVGGDSGPLHIAEALGTPVLAIHGPSDSRISGPGRQESSVIRLPISCSPCYDATYPAECPLGHHRCMVDLSSDAVFQRVSAMLPAGGMKILAVKLADLGDVLLITPALRALRESFPDSRIDSLIGPAGVAAIEHAGIVDRIIPFEKSGFDRVSRSIRAAPLIDAAGLVRDLRSERYDKVILFHHLTTAWGAMKFRAILAGIGGETTGLDNGRGGFLDSRVPDRGFGAKHEVEYWLDLAASLGARTNDTSLSWRVSEEEERAAARLVPACDGKYAVIHPGTGAFAPARRWPVERFAEVARRFEKQGLRTVIVGTETELTQKVAGASGGRSLDLGGRTSLGELGAVIENAELFAGNDSGVMHLAAAVGTPVVAVFGPSNDAAWRPWTPIGRSVVVRQNLPCTPCFYRGFSLGLRNGCPPRTCLQLLTVDEVMAGTAAISDSRIGVSSTGLEILS